MQRIEIRQRQERSRGNTFSPQPLSRVPSRRIAPRTPLAMRDCRRLKPVAAPDPLPRDQADARRALLERVRAAPE